MQIIFHRFLILFTLGFALSSCNKTSTHIDDIEKSLLDISEDMKYYPKKSLATLDSIVNSMTESEKEFYHGHITYLQGTHFYTQNNISESLEEINKAVLWFAEVKPRNKAIWEAKNNLVLGWIAESAGNPEQAKINYVKAKDLILDEQLSSDLGFAYIGIGRVNKLIGEPYIESYHLGINTLQNSENQINQLYVDKTKYQLSNDSLDVESLFEIAQAYEELKLFGRAAGVYKDITHYYISAHDYPNANKYIDKAIKNARISKTAEFLQPALLLYAGSIYFGKGELLKAKETLLKAILLYEKYDQKNRLHFPYYYLYQVEKRLGNTDQAYEYLRTYSNLKLQAQDQNKAWLAKIVEINSTVSLLEGQIMHLKFRRKMISYSMISISTILILIIILITSNLTKRNKALKLQTEREKQELQKLLLIAQEKKEILKRLGHNNPDEKLNNAEPINPADQFDLCYSESMIKFKDSFPELSKTEVKYAVMFGLGWNKEFIAKIQQVGIASIRKSRQRIRNKLKMETDVDIEVFSKNFIDHSVLATTSNPELES